MRISKRFALVVAGLAAFVAAPSVAGAQPRYRATIVRTAAGVPHIRADDFAGLGYGAGYTAAEDSFCILAEQNLSLRGERSRVFGADGPAQVGFTPTTNLESDLYFRVIGERAALRAAYARTSPEHRALVEGFVAGFNRFLTRDAARIPEDCRGKPWVRAMTVDDLLRVINSFGRVTTTGFAPWIVRAAPPTAPSATTAPAPPAAPASLAALAEAAPSEGLGSNGWAFGGDVTANGRGMVVGNPHFPWYGAYRFRQMHLTIPGRFDVMGASLLASPVITLGFNRDVAWTHTVTTSTHHTLYELKLDPRDPTAYQVDGRREAMTRRTITVEVKDGPPVRRTVWATRWGPLVANPRLGLDWTATHAYALKDANDYNLRQGDAWIGIARARSVGDVRAVIGRTLGVAFINTIAADRNGDALYADVTAAPNLDAAKLSRCATETGRGAKVAATGIPVLDGSTAACDWDIDPSTANSGLPPGLLPDRLAPTVVRRDYVQNSNDSYWLANAEQPLPQAPPLIGDWRGAPSLRTQSGITEIRRLIGAGRFDQARPREAVLANHSLLAERTLDDLIAACAGRPALEPACKALRGWNKRADLDSTGAVLFFEFSKRIGAVEGLWRTPFDPNDPVATPRGLNTQGKTGEAILDALAAAAAELDRLKIPLDAPLGGVQLWPAGGERIPVHGGPGDAGILNLMISLPNGDTLKPLHGSSYIQVVGFDDDGPVADTILSYSQSTDPASPHAWDQTRAFSAKQWTRQPFTAEAIERAKEGPAIRIAE